MSEPKTFLYIFYVITEEKVQFVVTTKSTTEAKDFLAKKFGTDIYAISLMNWCVMTAWSFEKSDHDVWIME